MVNQILHLEEENVIESDLDEQQLLDFIRLQVAEALPNYDQNIASMMYNDITVQVIP